MRKSVGQVAKNGQLPIQATDDWEVLCRGVAASIHVSTGLPEWEGVHSSVRGAFMGASMTMILLVAPKFAMGLHSRSG